MGRFSATVHIKSDIDKSKFKDLFCDVLKKRGFEPCSEDEATASYVLDFGEGWVTLSNEEYKDNHQKAYNDLQLIVETLKTSAFSVEVVDSDFAILELHAPDGGLNKITVGACDGYGIESIPPSKEGWETFLQNGSWEQFIKTAERNCTFVEDNLCEIGSMLGISRDSITADYDELSNKEDALSLSFRKAAGKKVSLNAAFGQVFGEALAPLGYRRIKGKYPYLVRVIPGGEIIHIITYMNTWYPYPGQKKFDILGGIATVYRHRIDLNLAPKDNSSWLLDIAQFYSRTAAKSEIDNEYRISIGAFSFNEDSEASMYDALKYSLELLKRFVLSQLNTAVDITSALIYINRLDQQCSTNNFDSDLHFGGCGNYDEGLLYVKADDEKLKSRLKKIIDGTVISNESDRQKAAEKYKFFNDPVIHGAVLNELERRKTANTEILRSYGLSLWIDKYVFK